MILHDTHLALHRVCVCSQSHPWVSSSATVSNISASDAVSSAIMTAAVMATKDEEEQKVTPSHAS